MMPYTRKIVRVFPRRTKATPCDSMVYIGEPDMLVPECDEVHISVAFTWDRPKAERLEKLWRYVAPTKIGGPGTGMRGESFTPGMYLKPGYVITSRGCPNHCWFCSVPRREGPVRELPITRGWNVLDDNLLACSDNHIRSVFEMLNNVKQNRHRVQFTGGLEAARLKEWHVEELQFIRPDQIFFAYDTPDDYDHLLYAGALMKDAGFTRHHLRAYVLIGYPKDTIILAETRLREAYSAGFTPMAMLWRNESGERKPEWAKFQCQYARPAIARNLLKATR